MNTFILLVLAAVILTLSFQQGKKLYTMQLRRVIIGIISAITVLALAYTAKMWF
jgi:hypothetical protein